MTKQTIKLAAAVFATVAGGALSGLADTAQLPPPSAKTGVTYE